MSKWIKSIGSVILVIVITKLLIGGYFSCNSNKFEAQLKKHQASLQAFKDSLYDYNIDSLFTALKNDKSYNIVDTYYEKGDSILHIILKPSFNYQDKEMCQKIYNQFVMEHKLQYASNIIMVNFVKDFPRDSINSVNFNVPYLLQYVRYGSRYYDAMKKSEGNAIYNIQ